MRLLIAAADGVRDEQSCATLVEYLNDVQVAPSQDEITDDQISTTSAVHAEIGRAWKRIADANSNLAALTAAAIAFSAAGDSSAADDAARRAFDMLAVPELPERASDDADPGTAETIAADRRLSTLMRVTSVLSAKVTQKAAGRLAGATDGWTIVCRARLLQLQGQPAASLAILREGIKQFPDSPELQSMLLGRLQAGGYSAEIVRTFLPLVNGSAASVRAMVASALVDLGRFREAWRLTTSTGQNKPPPDISGPAARGDLNRSARSLRTLLRRLLALLSERSRDARFGFR